VPSEVGENEPDSRAGDEYLFRMRVARAENRGEVAAEDPPDGEITDALVPELLTEGDSSGEVTCRAGGSASRLAATKDEDRVRFKDDDSVLVLA